MRLRPPQGLLLHGPEGVGQFQLALVCARMLLCESPRDSGEACGSCSSCRWLELGNHPDFRLVQPDALDPDGEEGGEDEQKRKSDHIRVDQIRDLQRFLAVGTHRGGLRVIVLHPADTMNHVTQNALLKSLEEPPPRTLFILVTSAAHRLLPTVRSRCRSAPVPLPDQARASAWLASQGVRGAEELLALAGGAPLAALKLAEVDSLRRRLLEDLGDPRFDPVGAAERCLKAVPAEVVTWIQRWLYDLLSSRVAGVVRYHRGDDRTVHSVASRCDPVETAALLRKLARARRLASHPLNAKLFLEDVLIAYQGLIGASRAR